MLPPTHSLNLGMNLSTAFCRSSGCTDYHTNQPEFVWYALIVLVWTARSVDWIVEQWSQFTWIEFYRMEEWELIIPYSRLTDTMGFRFHHWWVSIWISYKRPSWWQQLQFCFTPTTKRFQVNHVDLFLTGRSHQFNWDWLFWRHSHSIAYENNWMLYTLIQLLELIFLNLMEIYTNRIDPIFMKLNKNSPFSFSKDYWFIIPSFFSFLPLSLFLS